MFINNSARSKVKGHLQLYHAFVAGDDESTTETQSLSENEVSFIKNK